MDFDDITGTVNFGLSVWIIQFCRLSVYDIFFALTQTVSKALDIFLCSTASLDG